MADHKPPKASRTEAAPGEPKGWRPLANPIPRFLSKVAFLDSGCWQWTAAIYHHGYGVFGVGTDLPRYAHRWAYLMFVGNIPEGYVVDHLCGNRACVNPDHLEAVPQRTNSPRGAGPALTRARYQRRTHCRQGHALTEETVYRHPSGRRICLICRREYDRAWQRAARAGMPTRRPITDRAPAHSPEPKRPQAGLDDSKRRFLTKVEKTASGCWNWTAGRFPTGYGKFRVGRSGTAYAHRWAYLFFVGPIPEGTEIDHLCRNRACVNPAHLEAVSRRENILRGDLPDMNRARAGTKTHCPAGHRYSSENSYYNPAGYRSCRACNREAQRRYSAKRKAKEATP